MRYMIVVVALVMLGGCGHMTAPTQPGVPALRITPSDGMTAVRLDAAIVLDLRAAVDRPVVESGVHLVSDYDMNRDCPDCTMDMVMSDSTMLHHAAQFDATRGHFSWNAAGTVCTFQPDSLMRAQMRYMVYMNGTMMDVVRRMDGTMMKGGMMGGTMMSDGGMVTHFTTMN